MHTVIGGLGKSGTTALYYAVRAGMPAGTLCLFEPTVYQPTNAPHVLAKILVQAGVDWASFSHFDKKIFIVRDPRDQLVSFVLYSVYNHSRPVSDSQASGLLDLLTRKEAAPKAVPLWRISEAVEAITGWDHRAVLRERHELCSRTLEHDPAYFRIQYDDFIAGRTDALADYLGFALPAHVEVPSSLRRVTRTRGTGDWRNWCTEEDVAYFRPVLDDVLRTFGFADAWDLPPNPVVTAEHGRDYLRRLIAEQRRRTHWRTRWTRGLDRLAWWTRERYISS